MAVDERERRAAVWQSIVPDHHPAAIARVQSVDEVVAALASVRQAGRRVSIVSGGHSYIANGLQNDTVLLWLSGLADIEVDAGARTASVGPAARNGDLDAALAPLGLVFPVGHSPTVGLGGYLLGGGLSWNPDGWGGGACFSVTGADVVLASGEPMRVSADSHPDLFWALRGAGPFFPGVVTRFDLALRERPAVILERTARFDLDSIDAVADWAATVGERKDPNAELSVTFDRTGIVLSAVAFSDTPSRAETSLQTVAFPARESLTVPRTLAELLAANDDPPARYGVETVWTDDVAAALRECALLIARAPSARSLLFVGLRGGRSHPNEAAFVERARAIVFSSAVWDDAGVDGVNLAWSDDVVARLGPRGAGAYISETDYFRHPERIAASFTPAAWARLADLRAHYDPDRLFYAPLID